MNQQHEEQQTPWPRIFLLVVGALALFLFISLYHLYGNNENKDAWNKDVRSHLASLKANNPKDAMPLITKAFQKVDWVKLEENNRDLGKVAQQGWSGQPAETNLLPLLEQHNGVIYQLGRAAARPDCNFPPTKNRGKNLSLPKFSNLENLSFLLVANARLQILRGNREEGIQRLVEALSLGSRFCQPRDQAHLQMHLAGLTMMDLATSALTSLLETTPLPSDVYRHVGNQLAIIDDQRQSAAEALISEAYQFQDTMEGSIDDLEKLASVLQFYDPALSIGQAQEKAKALGSDIPTFAQEHVRVWQELSKQLALPIYQQQTLDNDFITSYTTNRLVQYQFSNITPVVIRDNLTEARLRLLRAFCGAMDPEQPINIDIYLDPFADASLSKNGNILYSIGPDKISQQGLKLYDPQKGLTSKGDLVIRLSQDQELIIDILKE
jgi:hypothetical protein